MLTKEAQGKYMNNNASNSTFTRSFDDCNCI